MLVSSCGTRASEDGATEDLPYENELLAEIIERDTLRALTTYSATSYFLYRGAPMGYEYELLKRFADHLGVKLSIRVSDDLDSMLYELQHGLADVVAHSLAITTERKNRVNFTDPLFVTHQVLVQRKPENWRTVGWKAIHDNLVHDPMDLIDDTVSVRVNSSYFHRLRHLSEEIGGRIVIDTLPGKYSTDEIIKMVADGTLKYTVADKNIASISASYYPNLDINVPMSFSQRIAWALPKWDTTLVGAVNEWLAGMKESSDYYAIYNKYFRNERNFRRRVKSEFYSLNENKISPFDDIIREGARTIGWDWRLLASMIYQESKFLPDAESWAEARGLMQIMPSTAEELGIGDVLDPHENISGGVRYLANLESYFEMIPDSLERIKFTLASFNCGVGHVLDARRLAKKHGLNPNVWKGNVEEMALKLSFPEYFNDPVVYYGYVRGEEPYTYVNQIFERYAHYRRFIPLSEEDVKAEES